MKILYIGQLSYGSSSSFRVRALRRLGHTVIAMEVDDYTSSHPLLNKIEFRLQAGPQVRRLNRDLLLAAAREKPDVFWADKGLSIQPGTLRRLRAAGIVCVSYMIDNAFGPRRDPGWRLYHRTIPLYDLHVTQRSVNIPQYQERGAKNVIKIQTAYEPSIHFPAPTPITDAQRSRQVSFIGTPYDDRAQVLEKLGAAGLPVIINGNTRAWQRALSPHGFATLFGGSELYEAEYREAVWHSKINLSFLTKANQDEYTHKSFEIAACGGFLLAERSPGHLERFVEDQEAVFFSTTEELMGKIARYLPDEAARARIALAGLARAQRSGYSNDAQMRLVLDRVEEIGQAHD